MLLYSKLKGAFGCAFRAKPQGFRSVSSHTEYIVELPTGQRVYMTKKEFEAYAETRKPLKTSDPCN